MNRIVENQRDLDLLIAFLRGLKMPFTITLARGRRRTTDQNRLQRLWMNEISEQLGDQTPEEVRAYCKLTIGVPILRAENERFAEAYDKNVKPLPYEQKLELMAEPIDVAVTRLMTTKQKAAYLDAVFKYWTERGLILTQPEERG